MTVLLLARSAVLTVATGAVLLGGLTVAGAASAEQPEQSGRSVTAPPANENAVLRAPGLTQPHGRKIG